jgi:hypothetical protein
MRALLTTLLLLVGGLVLLAFGGIGLLFALGGQPPDAGAVGFTGGCVIVGLLLCGLALRGLFRR